MGILDGKVAIVTGGGRGIGQAVSLALAREGAKVVVADLGVDVDGTGKSSAPAEETVAQIKAAGGEGLVALVDVAVAADCEQAVATAIETYGKLDIVVTPAGILRDRMVFNMTEDEWDAVMNVHAKGTFNMAKYAAIHWRTTRAGGRLITFTSGSGLFGAAGQPNYAAAKMAIVGLTLSCANALAKYGVTCNSIAPNANTRMVATIPGFDMEADPAMTPENVAPAVVYLASDDAAWCNGQVIGSWSHQVILYSPYQPEVTIYNNGPWTDVAALGKKMRENFEQLAYTPHTTM